MSSEHDALERLRKRWRDHLGRPLGGPGEAVGAVSSALWAHEYYAPGRDHGGDPFFTPELCADMRSRYPVPTRDDVLDALAQIVDARAGMDRDEARLIDAARAHGVEWEEVGEALGYPSRSAKQSARARRSSLTRSAQTQAGRWVRRRPLVDGQPAGQTADATAAEIPRATWSDARCKAYGPNGGRCVHVVHGSHVDHEFPPGGKPTPTSEPEGSEA